MKRTILLSVSVIILLYTACTKDNSNETTQTIITSDSSEVSGRLYVDVMNSNGSAYISGAKVSLFLSYEDMKRNISLYTFESNGSGRVDFGYILKGNYYLSGYTTGNALRDSTVAQILPKRSVTRKLYLH